MTTLSTPFPLRSGHTLPNRIAKVAMTEGLADARNQPTDRLARLYRRWADGGAGLQITGNMMVDRRYLERPENVVVDAHTDMAALARLAEAANATGGVSIVQLNHPGRQCNRFVNGRPVAPSRGPAVKMVGFFARPRALEVDEIDALIEAFVAASRRVVDAGFHGVQIHSAHGYLLSQFLSPLTNQRTDAWGHTLEGRARALLTIVERVRDALGDACVVSVKLNASDFLRGGLTEEDSLQVATWLSERAIDLLEISGGTYESPALFGQHAEADPELANDGSGALPAWRVEREAYFRRFATAVRAATDTPILLTGGIRSRAVMDALLEDAVDVIGLARPLCMAPDGSRALIEGRVDRLDAPATQLGFRPMEAAAEGGWYGKQLERLADGEEPDPSIALWPATLGYVAGQVTRAWTRQRP